MFKLAKLLLTVLLTAYRSSLSLDGFLRSIITFQMNREGEICFEYCSSNDVLEKAKKATWEYNKAHQWKEKVTLS